VNLRSGPSTSDEIAGVLTYDQVVMAIGISEDGQWFQLADGSWVASWVVRNDGECDSLTAGEAPAEPEEPAPAAEPEMAVSLPAGWESAFAACPALIESVGQLPAHIVLDLMYSPDPCASAELLLGELVFSTPFVALSGAQFDGMLAECPTQAAALTAFFDEMAAVNRPLAEQLQNAVTVEDRCEWGQAVLDQRMLPLPADLAAMPTSYGLLMSPLRADPPAWAWSAAVECYDGQGDFMYHVADTLVNVGFSQSILSAYGSDMCSAVGLVTWLSDLSSPRFPPGDQALYDRLVNECGLNPYNPPEVEADGALHLLSLARQLLADTEAVSQDPNLCDDPRGTIYEYAPLRGVASFDPSIPWTLRDCPDLAERFRQAGPSLWDMLIYMSDYYTRPGYENHCSTVFTYLDGTISLWPKPLPDCWVNVDPSTVTSESFGIQLPDGTLITDETPWHIKIAVLEREDVCAPLDIPVYEQTLDLPDLTCYRFQARFELTGDDPAPYASAQLVMRYDDGRAPTVETGVYRQEIGFASLYDGYISGYPVYTLAFNAIVHDPAQLAGATLDYELYLSPGVEPADDVYLIEEPMGANCQGMAETPACAYDVPVVVYPPDGAIVTGDVPLRVNTDPCAYTTAFFVSGDPDDADASPGNLPGRTGYAYRYGPWTDPVQEYIIPQGDLADCSTYYWQVTNRSGGDGGEQSTGTMSFYTNFSGSCTDVPSCTVAAPTPTSPVNNDLVDGVPALMWQDTSGCAATEYEVETSIDPNFASNVIRDTSNSLSVVPSWPPEVNNLTCTPIYWRVRGSRDGQTSLWSDTQTFVLNLTPDCLPPAAAAPPTDDLVAPTLVAPTLVGPINDQAATTTLPTLEWSYTGGIEPDGFYINVYSDAALTTAVQTTAVIGGDVRSWMPTTPLDACATYYWTVTAGVQDTDSSIITGPPSAAGLFSVDCAATATPSTPTESSPAMRPFEPLPAMRPFEPIQPPSATTIQPAPPQEVIYPGSAGYGSVGPPPTAERQPATPVVALTGGSTAAAGSDSGASASLSPASVLSPGLQAFLMGSASPADIYYLVNDDLTQLTDSPTTDDRFPILSPQGDLLAYLSIAEDGRTVVNVMSLSRRLVAPIWSNSSTLTILPAAPAWSPDGTALLLTMQDTGGVVGIYALDMRYAPDIGEPQLLIADAQAPVYSPNGRFIAFERTIDGMPSIVVMLATGGQETIIDTGLACQSPTFGENSIDLFFTCLENDQSKLYHYGLNGLNMVPVALDNVYNPSSGPGNGYLAIDDGAVVYFVSGDGSELGELVQLPGLNMTHVRWASAGTE
ncbi:MAG: SH3 domain-containing protein, partial [Chloroflexi bacterium]|nr:SH3 domain-containing protein [Chloroflexota bacterium]